MISVAGHALFLLATGVVIGGIWITDRSDALIPAYEVAVTLVIVGVTALFLNEHPKVTDREIDCLRLPSGFDQCLETLFGSYGRQPVESPDLQFASRSESAIFDDSESDYDEGAAVEKEKYAMAGIPNG